MIKLHIHWYKYKLTLAQLGDLQYFDLHKCRCGKEKVKHGFGYSPYFWTPKNPITGEPLL